MTIPPPSIMQGRQGVPRMMVECVNENKEQIDGWMDGLFQCHVSIAYFIPVPLLPRENKFWLGKVEGRRQKGQDWDPWWFVRCSPWLWNLWIAKGPPVCSPRTRASQRGFCAGAAEAARMFALNLAQATALASPQPLPPSPCLQADTRNSNWWREGGTRESLILFPCPSDS